MKAYKAKGSFKMGRIWQKFTKEITADDEESARDKILSVIGSKHGTKRTNIKLKSIDEMDPDEVEDLVIRDLLEDE